MNTARCSKTRGHGKEGLLTVCIIVTCLLFCRASAENNAANLSKEADLKIYLPREVTIEDDSPTLGRISIIRGSNSLVTKANEIAFGRFSVPGQEILIDRHVILSRLACNGIPASNVELTGAEKTIVKQKFRIVRGDQFVSKASSFMKAQVRPDSGYQWSAIRKPRDFVVPGTPRSLTLSPRLLASNFKNQAKVEIAVLSNGKKIAVRQVIFDLKYSCRKAVAKADIAAGAIIGPDNVRIEETASSRWDSADWKSPYGLVAKRALRAGTVIQPHMVGPAQTPIIVKRNHGVVIRIEKPGFLITAMGTALSDGRAGQIVKVRNVDSQRIIVTRINDDGSVEPVL